MTTRLFRNAGLASLTALNRQIVAQVDETTIAEEAVEEGLFTPAEGVVDPDAEEEEAESIEVRGRFATADPLGFNRVKEWIEAAVFDGSSGGMAPLIGAFVNEWAEELAPAGPGGGGGFPADLADRILGNEDFIAGAGYLPIRQQLDEMPPVFRTEMPIEGAMVPVRVTNNPLTGPRFTIEEEPAEIVRRYVNLLPPARAKVALGVKPGAAPETMGSADVMERRGVEAAADIGSQPGKIVDGLERFVRNPRLVPDFIRDQVDRSRRALPFISNADLIGHLEPRSSGGGGGGGGGGAVRRDLVFDREHLISQVADTWRSWMLDPNEPPVDWIGSQVDEYVREARAFWAGQGGQLDFDTYIKGKLKAHDRYRHIYRFKEPSESEEQFLQKFAQPITQLGQTGDFTRAQTELAVTSGGSAAGQLERVMRTPEVQGSGGFSRRLAQTLNSIGVG